MLHRLWLRIERAFLYQVIRLFRIRAASEKVARGFALGLVVNFFPTFGLGVLVSGFVARLFGGNAIAGLVGGALLTFFWPVLFYLNICMGAPLYPPEIPIEDVTDLTERTMKILVWGRAFTAGAILNSMLLGLLVYGALRLLYEKIRPGTLKYFRHHAKDHQHRFRRQRPL